MNFPKSMIGNAFRIRFAVMSALLAACSGGESSAPPIPVRLGFLVEPPATASIGVALNPQPAIQLLDGNGAPISENGILVTASLASGGGSLGGTVGVRTDAVGRADFSDLSFAGPAGPRTLRFSAPGLSAVISGQIAVGSGPATNASISAGNSQTTAAGTAVAVAPAVLVTDGSANPVAGVDVTFTVTAGGGSVTGGAAVTNTQGIATVGQWTMGTAIGLNSLSAAVEGVAQPLVFQATATVGPAAHITVIEGDAQTTTIGNAVATQPTVKVTDAFGNVITGFSVAFTIDEGGGTVTGGAPITDANGVAKVGSWRLGLVPGANKLKASRDAVSITFTATATDYQVTSVDAGGAHGCAIGADQITRCWGDNSVGQLGRGVPILRDSVPAPVSGAAVFTQVVSGDAHSCGLAVGGQVWCWGLNTSGELGNGGSPQASLVPVMVTGGAGFTQITASGSHTCGIDAIGSAYCWGAGGSGRLGDGATTSRTTPRSVGGGHFFSQISAGIAHTCGVRKTDGKVLCWGNNGSGRLGDGTTDGSALPIEVVGGTVFTSVSAAGAFTCALDTQKAAWCWGANASGQVGDGTTTAAIPVPTLVTGGKLFTSIGTGTTHACGITADFAAWCWGENSSGRLGDGTGTDRRVPTLVIGGGLYASIDPGDLHTCARTTAGSAICWGNNSVGQLGDGSQTGRGNPAGVKKPAP